MTKVRNELREYLTIDDKDDMTDAVELLCLLSERSDRLSDDLSEQIRIEMESFLKYYRENTEIVEREVTQTSTIRELIHR